SNPTSIARSVPLRTACRIRSIPAIAKRSGNSSCRNASARSSNRSRKSDWIASICVSPNSSITVRPWRTLLATLALTTAGIHAQEQTARLVKDANATKQNLYAGIGWVEPVGSGVVFPMDTLASGTELWVSDGTAAGTKLLKEIIPGTSGSSPRQGTVFGTGPSAKVAFLTVPVGFVSETGIPPEFELWVTDGTAAGTTRVAESAFPADPGDTYLRVGTTGGVFLEDVSYADGSELFFNNGTSGGTHSLNPLVGEVRKFKDPKNFVTSGAWCASRISPDDAVAGLYRRPAIPASVAGYS
ncbi:MAG: hypothetical protein EOO77_17015, partial [Oxalobacteraceae bacterium]